MEQPKASQGSYHRDINLAIHQAFYTKDDRVLPVAIDLLSAMSLLNRVHGGVYKIARTTHHIYMVDLGTGRVTFDKLLSRAICLALLQKEGIELS